jgi:hypothetical protein
MYSYITIYTLDGGGGGLAILGLEAWIGWKGGGEGCFQNK